MQCSARLPDRGFQPQDSLAITPGCVPIVSPGAAVPNGVASLKREKAVRNALPRQNAEQLPTLHDQSQSLADIILPEIKKHPEGLSPLEIKHLVRSGKSRFAAHPELGKRVDTTIGRMKKVQLIVKRPNGKLYPAMEGHFQN